MHLEPDARTWREIQAERDERREEFLARLSDEDYRIYMATWDQHA